MKKQIIFYIILGFCSTMVGQVTIHKIDVKCRGGKDGKVQVQVANAAEPIKSYIWNDGVDAKTRLNIPAGDYCVTVTDANDCTGQNCVTVEQPESALELAISISPDPNSVPCGVPQPVFVSASATGGDHPYGINGRPGAVSTKRVSTTTTVRFQVTDQNGCSVEKEQRVYILPRFCPVDPNEMVGPVGFDSVQWVSVKDTIDYTIKFENDPVQATAPAQRVMVTHQFDEDINPYSFRLGAFGFGDYIFNVPESRAFYQTRLDLVGEIGLFVDVTAGINVNTNCAFWIMESIDPETGLLPINPLIGFLPINDTITRGGEGFFNFYVRPKQPGHTGDTILASANIIFDLNEPIVTNAWSNLIDALPPATFLSPLPAQLAEDTIHLSWSGQDDTGGSGLNHIELYVSKDAAAYQLYNLTFPDSVTSHDFIGEYGSAYSFYLVGVDNTGNKEIGIPGEASTEILPQKIIELERPLADEYCISDTLWIEWSLIQISAVNISLSVDSGVTFQPLHLSVPASDTMRYFLIPQSLAGEYIQLKIASTSDTQVVYSSILPIKDLPDINAGTDKSICIGSVAFLIPEGGNTYAWSPDLHINNTMLTIPTVEPPSTMEFFVTGTDVFGCRNVDSLMVFVHPHYLDTVAHPMCNEDSVFVGGDYQTQPGFYTDFLSSSAGCDSTVVTEVSLSGPCPFPGDQVYVDKDATGHNNGTSWVNAFTDLQDALAAVEYFLDVTEIWIAEGTYYPSDDNRDTSYVLRDSVTIYGGFLGFEDVRSERSPDPDLVKLSGDIGDVNDTTDNVFHVITIDTSCTTCVLDGLTVEYGQSDGIPAHASIGAGLFVKGKVLIENLAIRRNTALLEGAAIYNSGSLARLTIKDCLFRLNTSGLERDILNSNGAEIRFEGYNIVED